MNGSIAASSQTNIAATTDGQGTDYIFYQQGNGDIMRALNVGQGPSNYLSMGPAQAKSPIAAAYGSSGSDDGAWVMYRKDGTSSSAYYQQVDRSGEVLSSGQVG